MDRERRQQLSQNSLSKWLYTQYEDVFKPNSQLIGWLFIAILVLLCGFFLTRSLLEANAAKSWQQYFTALYSSDPETSFQTLVDDRSSASGPAAAQIRLTYAQILANDVESLLASNKSKATDKLEKSIQMFQASQQLANNDGIRQQAVYGAAVAYETLAACRTDKDDFAEAEKRYKEIIDRWPDSFYGQRAAKRLVLLAKPETRSFYEFIATAVSPDSQDDEVKVDIDTTDFFSEGPGDFDPAKALDFIIPSRPFDIQLKNFEDDDQDTGISLE